MYDDDNDDVSILSNQGIQLGQRAQQQQQQQQQYEQVSEDGEYITYPGYDKDPKVKKVIDRCKRIPVGLRQKANEDELYRIGTLRSKLCTKRKADPWNVFPRRPGYIVHRGAAAVPNQPIPKVRKRRFVPNVPDQDQEGGAIIHAGKLAHTEMLWTKIQHGGMPLLDDPVLMSYLKQTKQKIQASTLVPLGVALTLLYAYFGGISLLDTITDWIWDGKQIMVPLYHLM